MFQVFGLVLAGLRHESGFGYRRVLPLPDADPSVSAFPPPTTLKLGSLLRCDSTLAFGSGVCLPSSSTAHYTGSIEWRDVDGAMMWKHLDQCRPPSDPILDSSRAVNVDGQSCGQQYFSSLDPQIHALISFLDRRPRLRAFRPREFRFPFYLGARKRLIIQLVGHLSFPDRRLHWLDPNIVGDWATIISVFLPPQHLQSAICILEASGSRHLKFSECRMSTARSTMESDDRDNVHPATGPPTQYQTRPPEPEPQLDNNQRSLSRRHLPPLKPAINRGVYGQVALVALRWDLPQPNSTFSAIATYGPGGSKYNSR
ncbi:hypothetical protein C8R46DRAFT_1189442 [Mycena filopes]|nr:hypothetical protein C8R46DRAFT_1189442 [Mycena filopes]